MIKILCLTAMHGRPQISKVFVKAFERFAAAAPEGVKLELFAVVSGAESVELCYNMAVAHVEYENKPIGRKWNYGLAVALDSFDFDYLMIMGDDDLISNQAWEYYLPHLQNKEPYFGFNQIYFYNTKTTETVQFSYLERGVSPHKLIGCGRMIRRDVVENASIYVHVKCNKTTSIGPLYLQAGNGYNIPLYGAEFLQGMGKLSIKGKPEVCLWRKDQDSGLDAQSDMSLLAVGVRPMCIETDAPLMMDLKSDTNIWAFERQKHLSRKVVTETALAKFEEREDILKLRVKS